MALLRSYLFVPGNREDLHDKALAVPADAIVMDLEDAVPATQKERARLLVRDVLQRRTSEAGPRIFVRINARPGSAWESDLRAVVQKGLFGIRLPKTESIEHVREVDALLTRLEADRGLLNGGIELTLAVESASGVEHATGLAACCARVRNLCFGSADFSADVRADVSPTEIETLYARSRLVVSSRLAGLDPPIAHVHTRLEDDVGLQESCDAARRLGYFGRSCVHPRQVKIVNAAFTPQPDEVARARRIIDAYERAGRHGLAATTAAGGEFVDPAVVRQAQGLLSLAASCEEASSA